MLKKIQTDITVGIPCYNCRETIEDTLISIQMQTYSPKEILIVDDNSTQNYDDIFARYKNIRHIKLNQNSGVGVVRQEIVKNCKTKYLTMIDSDDIFLIPYALQVFEDNGVQKDLDFLITLYQAQEKNYKISINNNYYLGCHGKLYNTDFMKKEEINFCPVRTQEEGFVNRFFILHGKHKVVETPTYFWRYSPQGLTKKQEDIIYETFPDLVYSFSRSFHHPKNQDKDQSNLLVSVHGYYEQMRLKYGEKDKKVQKYKKLILEGFEWDKEKVLQFRKNDMQSYNSGIRATRYLDLNPEQNIIKFIEENFE